MGTSYVVSTIPNVGGLHVPSLLLCKFPKGYIFDLESPLRSLWYFSLFHKINIV